MASLTLSGVNTRLSTEITNRATGDKALATDIAALEAQMANVILRIGALEGSFTPPAPPSPPLPVASFTAVPLSGYAPLTVAFTDTSTNPTSWAWAFGDGATSTAQNPSHTYSSVGPFTASLTVTNASGSSGPVTRVISTFGVIPPSTGSLQERIDAASPGDTLTLTGVTFNAPATVNKALTLVGGTLTAPAGTTGLTIAHSNVTLNGMTITGFQHANWNSAERGIYGAGSLASPLTGLVIENCHVSNFGGWGILVDFSTSPVLSGNTVTDIVYAGIKLNSAIGSAGTPGSVSANTVQRIGIQGAAANQYNAYGIDLERIVAGSNPVCTYIVVDGNTVTDVPSWHGIDTHAGTHITYSNNTVRRCARALWAAGDSGGLQPANLTVTGNTLLEPVSVTGGTNPVACTISHLTTGTFTGNIVTGWGSQPFPYDYLGASTGLTVSGNTITP